MTTTTSPITSQSAAARSATPLGLGNLVRKDLAEWTRSKRPWIVLAITTSVFLLAAANTRIEAWVLASFPEASAEGVKVLSFSPLDNLLEAVGSQFSVFVAIFATMSLLIAERESGTLAWTVSKPVSRTSVLVSKWLTASFVLWMTAVAVPVATTAGLVAILYGPIDPAMVVSLIVLLASVPMIFVAIALTASTLASSQAAVGAIGLGLFLLPSIAGGLLAELPPFFPTSIFSWALSVSLGGPAPIVTPLVWAAGIAGLFVLARHRLRAMDL